MTHPIIVYALPGSPRSEKVLLTAKYGGVDLMLPEVVFRVTNTSPEYLAKFPSGSFPALEHGDLRLIESNAIAHCVLPILCFFLHSLLLEL